jgi:hypothetical protein
MAAPQRFPITLVRGDDETVVVTITSDGTTPVDITGRTYTSGIGLAGEAALQSGACVVTDALAGEVTITFSDTVTAALATGFYTWDLVETSGTVAQTLHVSPCQVVARVAV